jgi:hypothetical protein
VGHWCSSGEVQEEDDDCTYLTEGINGCLGGGGGSVVMDDGGDNFLLIDVRLGARRVKNEGTTV